jgi:SAM-dependent methyltransferase
MRIPLAPRNCPACNTSEASKLFAEGDVDADRLDQFAFSSRKLPEYMHWRLWECRGCDILYASPAPRPEDLANLYRDAAFDSRDEAGYASRTYAAFLPRIKSRLPDLDGAMDVGTGDGAFLRELLAAGFREVVGIEPSAAPVAAADPGIRPLIRQEVFRPETCPSESLSLVCCFQTIEHLPDPLTFCRTALGALKPGGVLFLIGHNWRAASARVLGLRSPIFDIEHLQLFSPRGYESLLRRAGFESIKILPVWNSYPLKYWTRLFPLPAAVKTRAVAGLERSLLGNWTLSLPAGNLAIVASKASDAGQ